MKRELRLYSFVNPVYMSQIQLGIQTAHLVGELSVDTANPQYLQYVQWAADDKTIIVLSGGPVGALLELEEFFKRWSFEFMVGSFREDEYSLGGVITATGLILPETIFRAKAEFDKVTRTVNKYVYTRVDEFNGDVLEEIEYGVDHPYFELIEKVTRAKMA